MKKNVTSLNKKESALETKLSDLEAKNSQLKKNVTFLTKKDSALETKLFDLKSEVDKLKAVVRLNTFLIAHV